MFLSSTKTKYGGRNGGDGKQSETSSRDSSELSLRCFEISWITIIETVCVGKILFLANGLRSPEGDDYGGTEAGVMAGGE